MLSPSCGGSASHFQCLFCGKITEIRIIPLLFHPKQARTPYRFRFYFADYEKWVIYERIRIFLLLWVCCFEFPIKILCLLIGKFEALSLIWFRLVSVKCFQCPLGEVNKVVGAVFASLSSVESFRCWQQSWQRTTSYFIYGLADLPQRFFCSHATVSQACQFQKHEMIGKCKWMYIPSCQKHLNFKKQALCLSGFTYRHYAKHDDSWAGHQTHNLT